MGLNIFKLRPHAIARSRRACLLFLTALLSCFHAPIIGAQTAHVQTSNAVTLTLGLNQIGVVKTSLRISTRISFPQPIKEIICGDLYDPATGVGGFVVQRLENEVYLKPVAAKAASNMFVKTTGPEGRTYTFSLVSVAPEQAHFIVNVLPSGKPVLAAVEPPRPTIFLLPVLASLDLSSAATNVSGNGPIPPSYRVPSVAEPAPPPAAQPAAQDPEFSREGSRVPLGDPVKQVAPYYPDRARLAGASGEVIVLIAVDGKGKVMSARALSGHTLLQEAAVRAARGWKFSPLKAGEGAEVRVGTINFDFTRAAEEADHGKLLHSLPRSNPMVIQMKRGG